MHSEHWQGDGKHPNHSGHASAITPRVCIAGALIAAFALGCTSLKPNETTASSTGSDGSVGDASLDSAEGRGDGESGADLVDGPGQGESRADEADGDGNQSSDDGDANDDRSELGDEASGDGGQNDAPQDDGPQDDGPQDDAPEDDVNVDSSVTDGEDSAETTDDVTDVETDSCADSCSSAGAFQCAGPTQVQACVSRNGCLAWEDVSVCPAGYRCCNGLCVQSDAPLDAAVVCPPVEPDPALVPIPPDMGRWCVVWNPDAVHWAFGWNTEDPCRDLSTDTNSTIKAAGLYSLNGINNAFAWCYGGAVAANASGDAAMRYVHDIISPGDGCVFRVAPAVMQIFDPPFPVTADALAQYHIQHIDGFDFAVDPMTLDVSQFGQSGSAAATIVDHHGRDHSSDTVGNDSDGHDWAMDEGTPIYAVANGRVLESRDRDVSTLAGCEGSSGGPNLQAEIYIQHDLGAGTYRESFVSYYGYLHDRIARKGDVVHKGDLIAHSGRTGCATAPELRFTVTRITNTIEWYQHDFTVSDTGRGDDSYSGRIEPYGWAGGDFDPWSNRYRDQGLGAFSIYLWSSGEAPPNPNW